MRTIKFRGKCIDETTDNGKWIVGSLLQDDNGIFMIVCFVDHHEQWYRVDPDTVGQYTGLKDRNGKDIYEGDIISGSNGSINGYEWPFVLQIEWDEEACRFNTPRWRDMNKTHYYDVIGNIHDNPEVPEGGKA